MKISWTRSTDSLENILQIYVDEKMGIDAIHQSIQLAKDEIAKKIWEENADKIMAQMDLKGLANLIAAHAAKTLR